jgi:hypothetical protein
MLLGRRLAFGFLVCLQAACASGSRNRVPEPPAASPSPSPPTAVAGATPDAAAPGATDVDPDECLLGTATGEPIATVALGHDIDPSNAPRPSNEGERLLFRQIYETLVSVDCDGRVVPALADSWRLDADGRTWIATLRGDARFSDGSPVTAADVRASWLRHSADTLHPDVTPLVEAIDPVADRTVAIRLHRPSGDAPRALAHPDLAVSKVAADTRWPLGTRGARIEGDAATRPSSAPAAIMLARDDGPSIRFLIARGDPRDFLDRGVDLLLTGDPATLDYAATLPRFQSYPLAWQRTYVLLTPGRARTAPSLPDDARQQLADDAVRGEARGAQGPFWWQTWADCGVPAVTLSRNQPPRMPRIVYEVGDGVARDLAERFIGLARAPSDSGNALLDAILPNRQRRTFERAEGLTGAALTLALRRGDDAGYLVSVDTRAPDPCRDVLALMQRVPWLDPETILPLVDARVRAILRRGVAGVTAEWDGRVVIASPIAR